MSARLNGGQPSGSLMKSVTEPARRRSTTLPTAPPMSMPVGSQISGAWLCSAKYTSSASSASADGDRHGDVAAGQKAEGDAVVARVDELHAGQQFAFFALHDRAFDGVLGQLVGGDDEREHERRAKPRAGQRREREPARAEARRRGAVAAARSTGARSSIGASALSRGSGR